MDFLAQSVPCLSAVLRIQRKSTGADISTTVLEYFATRDIVVHELLYDESEDLTSFATRSLSPLFCVLSMGGKNDVDVLILGDGLLECFVIACLRRTMDWSIVSCIGEYYHNNSCSSRGEEMVPFIEAFCPKEAKECEHVPSFLSLHRQLALKEAQIKAIIAEKRSQGSPFLEAEEELFERLFLAHGNEILSPGTVFDASISLVNLKEEEDD